MRTSCPTYSPPATRFLLETILGAPISWHSFDRTLVLLGDCIFTDAALDQIFEDQRHPKFYGDGSEIFAFAFAPNGMLGWLQEGVKTAEENLSWNFGKLWTLYRMMSNLPLTEYVAVRNRFYVWIVDGTTDIDSVEEYERFLAIGDFE